MKRAMAIVAHPDDIEILMAGTLLRLGAVGYELHYMNIANGCLGSVEYGREELIGIRRAEAQSACALLGAVYHESLCDDMGIFYDRATLARLGAVVREVAPEILLIHADRDYLEDHMNACRLALGAAFCRGMPNYETDPPRPPTDQPVAVYHAQPYGNADPLGAPVIPGLFVDIGDVLERKTAALAEHRSQKNWLDTSQGLDSYLIHMRNLAAELGALSGRYTYAEGWRQHITAGYGPAGVDPLATALAEHCHRRTAV